uniref:Uncharacterized protein n=1 Tax=Calidris pygmaea TaxID=425635 RepID=A0A8C3PPP6_9CHAR
FQVISETKMLGSKSTSVKYLACMKPNFVHSGTAGRASGKKEQNLERLQTKLCYWKGITSQKPSKHLSGNTDSQSKFSIRKLPSWVVCSENSSE